MDLPSADLLWSLFVSAVNSYRRDFVVRPFPQGFNREDGEKDFDHLGCTVRSCPPLNDVNRRSKDCDPQLLKLLKQVLNPKSFTIRKIKESELRESFSELLKGYTSPDFIFKIIPSQTLNDKFENLRKSSAILHAFHGSKIENFYSILNCGLRNNLNKVSLFGEGIYLSSSLGVSLLYSPTGSGWKHSMFGDSISCVALCEMVDHPDVKCKLESRQLKNESQILPGCSKQESTSSSDRCKIKGSEGGEIPEKYFVVRNDDLVRVKYLMLYCPNIKHKRLVGRNFFSRHQFTIIMLLYIFVLMCAGGITISKYAKFIMKSLW